MSGKIKVVIGGINGKMGRASARAILADPELELVGAFGQAKADYVGKCVASLVGFVQPESSGMEEEPSAMERVDVRRASGTSPESLQENRSTAERRIATEQSGEERVNVRRASGTSPEHLISNTFSDVLAQVKPDVYLDFTRAEAAFEHAKLAIEHGVHPVIGTSGLGEREVEELSGLADARKVGGMIVPNFSVGAVLMIEFARQAGHWFQNVEIVETHYTKKVDAPSGTAMHTVAKLASIGTSFNRAEVEEKELIQGARGGRGSAGVTVHSLRLPGVLSHQEVIFGSDGELLTIKHDGYNTNCFMKGVLMSIKASARMEKLAVGLDKLLALGAQPVA